jgi:hypothetical protein
LGRFAFTRKTVHFLTPPLLLALCLLATLCLLLGRADLIHEATLLRLLAPLLCLAFLLALAASISDAFFGDFLVFFVLLTDFSLEFTHVRCLGIVHPHQSLLLFDVFFVALAVLLEHLCAAG